MARRNSRRMKKLEPAVETLYIGTPSVGAGATGTFYLDLSQVASLVNRRFYRQGINWAVGGFKFFGQNPATIAVSKLPNTWVLSNSWMKSFKAWQQMIDNAVEEPDMESIKGRFLDFKIHADAKHHELGFGANLLPLDFQTPVPNSYAVGQWQASEFTIPVTGGTVNQRDIIAVGSNLPGVSPATGNNAVSMIQGYADSRGLPYQQDPNVPDDASLNWLMSIFNEGTLQDNAVVGQLEVVGDQAPYPFENDGTNTDTMYPGGETNAPSLQLHDIDQVTATTIGGITRLKGGTFPCGLIRFDIINNSEITTSYAFTIDLVPGGHRGYLCESMMEM